MHAFNRRFGLGPRGFGYAYVCEGGDGMLEYVRIRIGEGAAPACALCHPAGPETYLPVALVAEELERAASELPGCEPFNVILEGCEPLRHPDLPAIIAECSRARAVRIGMETDAGAFNIADNANGALSAGLRQIHVPLLGPDAASHGRLRAGTGFEQSCAGASAFLSAAERAELPALLLGVLPVCVHNIDQAAATVAVFARLGAVAVRMVPDAVRVDHPALRAACETGMACGVWVWVDDGTAPALLEEYSRAPFTSVAVTR